MSPLLPLAAAVVLVLGQLLVQRLRSVETKDNA